MYIYDWNKGILKETYHHMHLQEHNFLEIVYFIPLVTSKSDNKINHGESLSLLDFQNDKRPFIIIIYHLDRFENNNSPYKKNPGKNKSYLVQTDIIRSLSLNTFIVIIFHFYYRLIYIRKHDEREIELYRPLLKLLSFFRL